MDLTTLTVGKHGVSEDLVRELKAQLRLHKRVRVRFLRSARVKSERKAIAAEIVSKLSGVKLEDARGNTIILSLN